MKASEIMHDKDFPHGSLEGRAQGCKGSHCPGKQTVGMTCEAIAIRYAGDLSFKRRLDAGLTVEAILFEDNANETAAAPAKKTAMVLDSHGNAYVNNTITVADSETPLDELEDAEPIELTAVAEDVADVVTPADEPKRKGRKPGPIKHGTRYGFERRGCTTDEGCPGHPETGITCRQALRRHDGERPRRGAQAPAAEAVVTAQEAVTVEQIAEVFDVPAELLGTPEEFAFEPLAEGGTTQGVRADGLLSDLADAKDALETLQRELDDANAKAKHHEREAIGLEQQNGRLKEQLIQAGFSLDVATAARPAPRGVSCSVTITPLDGGGLRVTAQGMDAETAADLAGRLFSIRAVAA